MLPCLPSLPHSRSCPTFETCKKSVAAPVCCSRRMPSFMLLSPPPSPFFSLLFCPPSFFSFSCNTAGEQREERGREKRENENELGEEKSWHRGGTARQEGLSVKGSSFLPPCLLTSSSRRLPLTWGDLRRLGQTERKGRRRKKKRRGNIVGFVVIERSTRNPWVQCSNPRQEHK